MSECFLPSLPSPLSPCFEVSSDGCCDGDDCSLTCALPSSQSPPLFLHVWRRVTCSCPYPSSHPPPPAPSQPRYFSSRLIKACAQLPKVSKYFHIPFQSGDNDILKVSSRCGV